MSSGKNGENVENDQEVAARLRALAIGPERRSKVGRVRVLLPEIENALTAGVSLELILEELNREGLGMTLAYFKTTLHRVRQGKQTPVPAASPPASFTPNREGSSVTAEPEKPVESDAPNESLDGLTAKQKRERLADKFITPNSGNPLLNRLTKKGN